MSTCRAIVCRRLGPPQVLEIEEWPVRPPGPGEVQVELRAWGVNFVDVLMVAGGYQLKPALPFVPGLEAAGVVTATGDGVAALNPGDRVMTAHRPGGFAEIVTLAADKAYPIPDNMSFADGASFRSAYHTAWHALVQRGNLQPGETLLVQGAAGGVGMAAVHVGNLLGATVIGTVGSDEKLSAVKSEGADHVLNYSQGFRDQVKELTDGKGADVVLDPIGGAVFDESMRCINWGARLLIVGFAGGRAAAAKTNHLLIKGASAVGLRAGEIGRRNPAIVAQNMKDLMSHVAAGRLKPHISHRHSFEDFAAAMQVILDRQVVGKVVMEK